MTAKLKPAPSIFVFVIAIRSICAQKNTTDTSERTTKSDLDFDTENVFDWSKPKDCSDDESGVRMPPLWPCQWNNGVIPFTYNLFLHTHSFLDQNRATSTAASVALFRSSIVHVTGHDGQDIRCAISIFLTNRYDPRRLRTLVRQGLDFLEARSCIQFLEGNPVKLAEIDGHSYLFYTYSGVLESCCYNFYSKRHGRRVILISPLCSLPEEIAHVTLHGLGLEHRKDTPFSEEPVKNVLFNDRFNCRNLTMKMTTFYKKAQPGWRTNDMSHENSSSNNFFNLDAFIANPSLQVRAQVDKTDIIDYT